MAVFELHEFASERPEAAGMRRVPAALRQWRLRRHTRAQLSRLGEHLRRDVGFEPADAYDPLNGGATSLWKKAHMRPDMR